MATDAPRFFVTIACLSAFSIASLMCSPITEISNEIAEIDTENDTNHDYILIDQRQNGSANYRVNIDGVVIAFTPLGSLLSGALDDFDFSDEFDFGKPEKPPGDGQNSTEANAVGASLAGGVETNATVHKNGGKFKRRRYGGVSGLMRTIFNQRKNTNGQIK